MTSQSIAPNSNHTKHNKLNIQTLTLIGLMTAVLCVLGPWAFTLPFSPVPISLGTLGVYFVVIVLGRTTGTLSVLLYLLLGLVGVPVFTGFMGGPAKVFGPTGGYLIGYIFMAFICGYFTEKFAGKYILCCLGMCLGTLVCYFFGSIWMANQLNLSFIEACIMGALPYLPGDLLKILFANAIGGKLRVALLRAGLLK